MYPASPRMLSLWNAVCRNMIGREVNAFKDVEAATAALYLARLVWGIALAKYAAPRAFMAQQRDYTSPFA